MVDDSVQKSFKLLSEADKLADAIAQRKIQRAIERNLKDLNCNKLDYNNRLLLKRKDSWKDRHPLIFEGYGKEALDD